MTMLFFSVLNVSNVLILIDFLDNHGLNLLHSIANSGDMLRAQDLLNMGFKLCNVTIGTRKSKTSNLTPIHIAIDNRHADLLRLLLNSNGSDVAINIKGNEQEKHETPMMQALRIALRSIDSTSKKSETKIRKGKKYDEFLVKTRIISNLIKYRNTFYRVLRLYF